MFSILFRVLFSCIIFLLLLLFFYYQHQLDHSHRQAQLATIHSNTTTGNYIWLTTRPTTNQQNTNHNFNKTPPPATTDQQISTMRERNWSHSEPRWARERSASNRRSLAPPRSCPMSYAGEREGKHSERLRAEFRWKRENFFFF